MIGAWFGAYGDPDPDPGIRGEPQTRHPSPPQASRARQFPSHVKATQALNPVRGVTDTTLFKPKVLVEVGVSGGPCGRNIKEST